MFCQKFPFFPKNLITCRLFPVARSTRYIRRTFHPTLRAAPGACMGLTLFRTLCDVASRHQCFVLLSFIFLFFHEDFYLSSICCAKRFHKRRNRRSRWIHSPSNFIIRKPSHLETVGPAARQFVKNPCNLYYYRSFSCFFTKNFRMTSFAPREAMTTAEPQAAAGTLHVWIS